MHSYTVQPGDNLWTIAQQMQSSVENIITANPGITPYNLFVGQVISLPSLKRHMPVHHGSTTQRTKCGPGCVSMESWN